MPSDGPRRRSMLLSCRTKALTKTDRAFAKGIIMPLQELIAGISAARDDVQQTDFGYDVVPRYLCNNWQEIAAAQAPGAYPFDVIIIGAGMFGGYCAEKLYRDGRGAAFRILVLDAGAFLLQSHIQNLP